MPLTWKRYCHLCHSGVRIWRTSAVMCNMKISQSVAKKSKGLPPGETSLAAKAPNKLDRREFFHRDHPIYQFFFFKKSMKFSANLLQKSDYVFLCFKTAYRQLVLYDFNVPTVFRPPPYVNTLRFKTCEHCERYGSIC